MNESQNSVATPTAAVLIIGNEILSGRTQDTNLNTIAKKLTGIGIRLMETRVVADIENEIIAAVNALRARYTYVFTTGGIGATHDDITMDAIAKAFGVAVIEHPKARALLEAHYTKEQLNAARLRMARVPEGASLVDNPVSTAPGAHIGNVYIMAGVPKIMQAMLDGITATLVPGPAIHSISVSDFVAENTIADELAAIAAAHPDLDIGSYPWMRVGKWGTALVVRGTDSVAVKKVADQLVVLMAKHGGGTPEVTPSAG